MHEQPTVQPLMQALLACELARFVANVFKIAQRGLSSGGQQSTQSRECTASHCNITQALAGLFWMFEKRAHLAQIEAAKRRAFFFTEQNYFRSSGNRRAGTCTDCGRGAQRNRRCGDRTQGRETSSALDFSL